MNFFKRKFRPTWLATFITLVAVTLFAGLGMWQLERESYKQSIEQKFESRLMAEYEKLDTRQPMTDIEFKKLELKGRYDSGRIVLVDNRIYHGNAGYHVLSAFELADSNDIVLVNRGWVAVGASRENLPTIKPIAGEGVVRGIASLPGDDGYRLGEVSLRDSWPQVIPFIDIGAMQSQFNGRLLPFVLWLGTEQVGHYPREWDPVWAKPEKSRAYAVQWFCFAAISLILYLILNLRENNGKQ